MASKYQAPRGTFDVLPGDARGRARIERAAAAIFARAGYEPIATPAFEDTELFTRSSGETSDVVSKEMYTFEDKLNGESLTLRPEATAGIVRAAIEHSLTYERPQRAAGSSKFNLWRLWNFALDGLVSFSTAPLRAWFYVGAVIATVSVLYALFIITRVLIFGIDTPGYASLLIVVLLMGAIQLLSLGIIGESVEAARS